MSTNTDDAAAEPIRLESVLCQRLANGLAARGFNIGPDDLMRIVSTAFMCAKVEVEGEQYDRAELAERKRTGGPWAAAQSAPEFLDTNDTNIDFLDGTRLLVPGSITQLYSPRGLGKSLVAHALAVELARSGRRVLLVDRDNSRREVRRRLRAWGAADVGTLDVLTRDDAPPLTDASAWRKFPVRYDVVIIDSLDSSTEGVGERDSTKPSKAMAALLNVVRRANGPAGLVLGNTVKTGAHSRCSGVVEDRADIVFEVRDCTDLTPTGTKSWWEELPPAGADAWAQRATRRKKRDTYRLALVPSKFRVGEEPDPLALELDLSGERWQLRNVTAEMIAQGEAAHAEQEAARQQRLDTATHALSQAINATSRLRMNEDAIPLLMGAPHGLKRAEARLLIQRHAGTLWRLNPPIGRRGEPVCIVPVLARELEVLAGMQESKTLHQARLFEGSIPPECAQSRRQESGCEKSAPTGAFRHGVFLPGSPPEECPTCYGVGCPDCSNGCLWVTDNLGEEVT